jgi:hypothetical protein
MPTASANRCRTIAREVFTRLNWTIRIPLAFGFPDHFFALVNNTYNYEFLKDGWNVGYLKKEKEGYIAGFTGKNVKEKLQNALFYGVEEVGRGKIVYMANDPLFRGLLVQWQIAVCERGVYAALAIEEK